MLPQAAYVKVVPSSIIKGCQPRTLCNEKERGDLLPRERDTGIFNAVEPSNAEICVQESPESVALPLRSLMLPQAAYVKVVPSSIIKGCQPRTLCNEKERGDL